MNARSQATSSGRPRSLRDRYTPGLQRPPRTCRRGAFSSPTPSELLPTFSCAATSVAPPSVSFLIGFPPTPKRADLLSSEMTQEATLDDNMLHFSITLNAIAAVPISPLCRLPSRAVTQAFWSARQSYLILFINSKK